MNKLRVLAQDKEYNFDHYIGSRPKIKDQHLFTHFIKQREIDPMNEYQKNHNYLIISMCSPYKHNINHTQNPHTDSNKSKVKNNVAVNYEKVISKAPKTLDGERIKEGHLANYLNDMKLFSRSSSPVIKTCSALLHTDRSHCSSNTTPTPKDSSVSRRKCKLKKPKIPIIRKKRQSMNSIMNKYVNKVYLDVIIECEENK